MKKSVADVWEDLRNHVDFLAEAGGGFVRRRAEVEVRPEPAPASAPAAAGLSSLAGRPPQTAAERKALEEIDKFVRDFVAAWAKVMDLDRFDLAA